MARQRISKREYLTADGKKSVGPDAEGKVIYNLLAEPVGDAEPTVLKSWEHAGDMLSQFGFVTKVGNVVNSIVNGEAAGTREEALEEVDAFIEGLSGGVWREPGQAREPKWDKDVLATSLIEFLGDKAKGDVPHYRERLDDRSYFAKVTRPINPALAAIYEAKMTALGKSREPATPKNEDDLA